MAESTTPTRKARVELRLIVNGQEAYALEGFFSDTITQGIDRSVIPEWDLEQNRNPNKAIVLNARDRRLTVQEAQNVLTNKALMSYSDLGSSIDIRVRYNNIPG